MPIELDHTIVPSHHKVASAKRLAELLGVPWAQEPFPVYHFCFRVTQEDFDVILARIKAAGIPFRSSVRGPVDLRINTDYGGSMIYWNEPDGHQWEMLTVSYARAPG
jgi:catechol 2,3-dioxygenase-like lactoylglutathione lyase family enzyme